MKKNTAEHQLALLFIAASKGDNHISDKETDSMIEYFAALFKEKNMTEKSAREFLIEVLNEVKSMPKEEYDQAVNRAIQSVGQTYPVDDLPRLVEAIMYVAESDGLAEGEKDFVHRLLTEWELA